MVTSSIIKHLLCDDDSLSSYFAGKLVSFEDVRRRMFLLERAENRYIPDHYYRLSSQKSFSMIYSISDVLSEGLMRIAKEHLEIKGNRIHVKQEKQNDWQELLTKIPPLILQAAFLNKYKPFRGQSSTEVANYFTEVILPNTRFSALPYPFIPQLENYILNKPGLDDLHIHLSGSTETDLAWQDFLKTPDKVYEELRDGFKNQLVKEQFEQESHLTDPIKFRNLLLIARRIRNYIFSMLFPEALSKDKFVRIQSRNVFSGSDTSVESMIAKITSIEMLLNFIVDTDTPFLDGLHNPFSDFIPSENATDSYPLAVECLMYLKIFHYLSNSPKNSVASLFHFYLLILGLANRLLVQQTHQYGFEQFQKHTVNRLREQSERNYTSRFLQLHGNELRNINFLEGRFSPKASEAENILLLKNIDKGWVNLLEIQRRLLPEKPEPALNLIAHFIKTKEKERDPYIRHKVLRHDTWKKASVLGLMKERKSTSIKKVMGIDAAASEFDAPPEVFAPAFRLLRRRGFEHFTYHAGEDFFHILSGLRAIYESIDFLELQHGDRIGHAVASGVDARMWITNVGNKILIHQGEHLDNLLFSYHLIVEENIDSLMSILPQLALKISELCSKVYKKIYPVDVLLRAWLLRKYCPILLLSESRELAENYFVFCETEWSQIKKQLQKNEDEELKNIIREYQNAKCREDYEKIIEIKALEIFNYKALEELQLALLKRMHRKEIIIETLPTSNIRIGLHHNFETYHLWNWIKWESDGYKLPPIVVGTDDSGIFATNIYNEYANIYCHLTHYCKMAHHEAMDLIEKLDKNASIYKFQ